MGIDGTVARVNTLLIPAGFGGWALRVSEALVLAADFIGIAPVSRQTVTFGPVVANRALGILSTPLKSAWILALSANACQVLRALIITLAAS